MVGLGRGGLNNGLLSLVAKCGSGWTYSRASMGSQLTSSAPLVTTNPFPSSLL